MKIKSFECPKSIRDTRKKYLERQTLGQQFIFPIVPAAERIILEKDEFFKVVGRFRVYDLV